MLIAERKIFDLAIGYCKTASKIHEQLCERMKKLNQHALAEMQRIRGEECIEIAQGLEKLKNGFQV